jgi:hypothetical protein
MGLNDVLQSYLDALEYENLTEENFTNAYSSVKLICEVSMKEAKQFLASLS